jgi:hypothetical protein
MMKLVKIIITFYIEFNIFDFSRLTNSIFFIILNNQNNTLQRIYQQMIITK